MTHTEIHTHDMLRARLESRRGLYQCVVQNVDMSSLEDVLWDIDIHDVVFLGCRMSDGLTASLVRRGAVIFPELDGLPYKPYRTRLYTYQDLFDGFDPTDPCTYCDTPDAKIYKHWKETGRFEPNSIMEGLARQLHDMSITEAVGRLIETYPPQDRVAIMGGHSLGRDTVHYRYAAEISRELTRKGKLMLSGGGPGAMEATHLGAMLSTQPDVALDEAINVLATAPLYNDEYWLARAFEVINTFHDPDNTTSAPPSLGIPTWHYGHEPPSAFASHVAKYFSNALREEGLITLAIGGLIVAPGSAGTIQEVFQDTAQNHYKTTGWISPMVFLDRDYWTDTREVLPLLKSLSEGRDYAELIGVGDEPGEITDFVLNNPARKVDAGDFSYCDLFCKSDT